MNAYECLWMPMNAYECLWMPMNAYECLWMPPSPSPPPVPPPIPFPSHLSRPRPRPRPIPIPPPSRPAPSRPIPAPHSHLLSISIQIAALKFVCQFVFFKLMRWGGFFFQNWFYLWNGGDMECISKSNFPSPNLYVIFPKWSVFMQFCHARSKICPSLSLVTWICTVEKPRWLIKVCAAKYWNRKQMYSTQNKPQQRNKMFFYFFCKLCTLAHHYRYTTPLVKLDAYHITICWL